MKKTVIATIAICVLAIVGFVTFGVIKANGTNHPFVTDGHVLRGDEGSMTQEKMIDVSVKDSYSRAGSDITTMRTSDGKVRVPSRSFIYYDDESVEALSDGVLLDLKDLSDNFINNYYVTSNVPIVKAGTDYVAETANGDIKFGEHVFKLSDQKYLIRSEKLKVHVSDEDERDAEEFAQVAITEDGIAQILTKDNLWMTISPDCYIETMGGVKIYPITGIVDNGANQMTLSKMSVSMDDAIVLAKAEQRRQIVPSFNIDVQDGEDGEDGDQGITGENGANGAIGKAGSQGANGSSGSDGSTGLGGSPGANGASGSDGANGGQGKKGADASSISTTNSAIPALTIKDWKITARSLRGVIKINDPSSLLSEITKEQLADGYWASVTIINADTNEEIACWECEKDDYKISSSGTRFETINQEGREFAYFTTLDEETGSIDVLEPDTNYILSVRAYYAVEGTIYQREFIRRSFCTDSSGVSLDEKSATVDSLTISANISDIYWQAKNITGAKVYLLTQEQAEVFDYETATGKDFTGYLYEYDIDYLKNVARGHDNQNGHTIENGNVGQSTDLLFITGGEAHNNITPDTPYVVRVIAETTDAAGGSNISLLSPQELEAKTLKRTPLYYDEKDISKDPGTDERKRVTQNFNRVSQAFEVYRPTVTDQDAGIARYFYTAYDKDGNEVKTIEVDPYKSDPVEFFLPTGPDNIYTFGVKVEFFDNEKTVFYELQPSLPTYATGVGLPTLSVQDFEAFSSRWAGTLMITNNDNTLITNFLDNDSKLELRLFCDGVYDGTISYQGVEGDHPVTGVVNGVTYTLNNLRLDKNTGKIYLDAEFDDLKFNTSYQLEAVGSVDLHDGNGPLRRTIGAVGLATVEPNQILTKFTEGKGSVVDVTIQASFDQAEFNQYDKSRIAEGSGTIQLFRGNDISGYKVGAKMLSSADLERLVGPTGLQVQSTDFTEMPLEAGQDYTIYISMVRDETAQNPELSYKNEYTPYFSERTYTITTGITLPALPGTSDQPNSRPSGGINATPVTVKDAREMHIHEDRYEGLPDDAVVGYQLDTTFNNVNAIGRTITFYAYEYQDFIDVLNTGDEGTDPVMADHPDPDDPDKEPVYALVRKTIDFEKDAGGTYMKTTPRLMILFGAAPEGPVENVNGYHVTYAGDVVVDEETGKLAGGMGRGYRYEFAYTVDYHINNDDGIYPYGHDEYEKARDDYGIGQQVVTKKNTGYTYEGIWMNNKTSGDKYPAYVLNSGIQHAPYVEPEFHTYVDILTNSEYDSVSETSTVAGKVKYSYSDPDGAIRVGADTGSTIYDTGTTQRVTQKRIEECTAATMWGEFTFTGTTGQKGKSTSITVDCSRYEENYDAILGKIYGDGEDHSDPTTMIMGNVIADWAWTDYYQRMIESAVSSVQVKLDMSTAAQNYIDVKMEETEPSLTVSQRTVAMHIRLQDKNAEDKTRWPYDEILPVSTYGKTCYARIMLSDVPEELTGKDLEVHADVYYATGDTGWGYADKSRYVGYYAMRTQVMYVGSDTFEWGGWFVKGGDYDLKPFGSFFETEKQPSDIIPGIEAVAAVGNLTRYHLIMPFYSEARGALDKYVYPFACGVEYTSTGGKGEPGTTYLVPVKVGYIEAAVTGGGKIDYKVPEVVFDDKDLVATGTGIYMKKFSVKNITEAKQAPTINIGGNMYYEINLGLYSTRGDVPGNPISCTISGKAGQDFMRTAVDAAGNVVAVYNGTTWDTAIDKYFVEDTEATLDGKVAAFAGDMLQPGTGYYVGYSMTIGGSRKTLADSDSTAAKPQQAVYYIELLGNVTTEVTNVTYSYTTQQGGTKEYNYFNRFLGVEFKLSRTQGVRVQYEIYPDTPEGQTAAESRDLTKAVIDFTQTENMVQTDQTILKDNNVSINVSPYLFQEGTKNPLQGHLVPGGKYIIRVNAVEGTGAGAACKGYDLYHFTVPFKNINTTLLATDRKKDSITFSVSVYDAIKAAMGYHSTEAPAGFERMNNYGLFAVRFEAQQPDDRWKRINTVYDEYVYSMEAAVRQFTLNSTTAPGQPEATFTPGRKFRMNIYSVYDNDLDGLSYPVLPGDESSKKTYEYFFSNVTKVETAQETYEAPVFTGLLENFWGQDMYEDVTWAGVSGNYLIGTATAETADDKGVYIGTRNYKVSGKNKVLMTLEQSSGLENADRVMCGLFMRGGDCSNTLVLERPKTMFVRNADDTYSILFDFNEVDYTILSGTYDISIKLYVGDREYQISDSMVSLN